MHTDVHALQRNVKYLVLCGNTCTLPSEVWTGYICNAMAWERTNPSLGSSYKWCHLSVCTSFLQCVWCHKPLFADIWLQLEVQDGTMMRAWSAKRWNIWEALTSVHLFSILHGCVWSCLIFLLLLLQSNWVLILSESAYLNLKLSLATTHKEKAAITEIS